MPDQEIEQTRPNAISAEGQTRPVRINPTDDQRTSATQPVRKADPTQPVRISNSSNTPQPVQPTPGSGIPPTIPESAGSALSYEEPTARPFRKRWVILLGILAILVLGGVGSFFGYQSAVTTRLKNEQSQISLEAASQYQLGLADLADGRLEIAVQRFVYVIQLDPNFPGVQEKLVEAQVKMAALQVPTMVPTIMLTPTVDTRGEQDLFNQLAVLLKDKKWDNTIAVIESLRKKNLSFHSVDVDGFYYLALRGRGIDKILKTTDLEGGIYDLALAERFAILDRDAANARMWARTYISGASFWLVDWEKAVYYFGQVFNAAPSIRDGSNLTARERYKKALIGYGDFLWKKDEICNASKQYELALQIDKNPGLEPTATEAAKQCHGDNPTATQAPSSATPTPTVSGTPPTATPTGATPTPTRTNTPVPPSATPPAAPTNTPTPTKKP